MEPGGTEQTEHQPPLGEMLEFSAEELALNRQGHLSPAQQARVKRSRRWGTVLSLVIAVVVVAFLVVLALHEIPQISNEKGSSSEVPLVAGVLALMALVAITGVFRSRRQFNRYASGRVATVEGVVKARVRRMRGNVGGIGAPYGGGVRYELTIGKTRFFVASRAVLDAFEPGRRYRGYYAGKGLISTLLSAEPAPTAAS